MEPHEEALAHRKWALVSAEAPRRFDARWRLILDDHMLRLDAQLAARLVYTHVTSARVTSFAVLDASAMHMIRAFMLTCSLL